MKGIDYRALGALKSVLRNRGLGIKAKKCLYEGVKVFYGQEPLSGESTTKECGVNYQLLAVITEVAKWGTPSCSRSQPAADNGVRDG